MPDAVSEPYFVIRRSNTVPYAYWNERAGVWTRNLNYASGYRTAQRAMAAMMEWLIPSADLVQLTCHRTDDGPTYSDSQ